eukprot:NODE_2429_length_926_cov_117.493729_g1999_i0.p1 GENE.NODE_2429_length_926_cov_117.493729_g1999_i0~~NODE_2429_length_926_cov_117.493729_g1999_i0.p1  ORF type:complete len:170 (+),score=31.02 NODE_2429_length_926_cov_117.493729_g1999_i0:388-897(+)
MIVAIITIFATIIALTCCGLHRTVPVNYGLLAGFTLAEAYLVSFICARYDPMTVMAAMGITASLVVALTIYAAITKTDFTGMGIYLFAALFVFALFGLFSIFFGVYMRIIYCFFGVLLFSVYLIFDTQMILGNKRVAYSREDYVLAAVNLYLDIINLFVYILQILGSSD